MLWELLMTVISCYLAISIPFIIAAFGPRSPVSVDSAWAALASQWACDAILLCDSVLRANCFPFLPRGREVFMKSELTHSAMRTHYVQAKLRLDVLATLPYEALAPIGFATTGDTKTILLAVALLRLPRTLPLNVATEMALTGDPISAERGYELGLVNRLAEPGSALDAAVELAEQIACNGPLALAATKQILEARRDWTDEEFWDKQMEIAGPVFGSEDAQEGAVAFTEKRDPVWQGR